MLADKVDHRATGRQVLFIQATEPAAYPPLIHAATLFAEAGWRVTFLSAPVAGKKVRIPTHQNIRISAVPTRPSHVTGRIDYLYYGLAAASLALRIKPDVVYASDPLGAGPGCLAARLAGATLVYHEHDSPEPASLPPIIAHLRAAAARSARLVVFPNEDRARIAQAELGFDLDHLRIVWNLPRRTELPKLPPVSEDPVFLYYHGTVGPELLPDTVLEAMCRFGERLRLRIVGPEAPAARGYVAELLQRSRTMAGREGLVEYLGEITRDQLLVQAAGAHIGLALMPRAPRNVNLRHLAGASNKAFDYMAAGLALLVSDLADWRDMFVTPGFGLACDPCEPCSIAAALDWFIDHREERRAMAARGRNKIETEWNYERAFAPIMAALGVD